MDAGLVLLSYHRSWDDAAYAEENGFASVGFVDTPLIAGDPFVAMALAAERTSALRVGTMLAIPSNRNAAACVTAVASINRIAPGRIFLGLGTGNTGRAVFGHKAMPVDRFADYVASCRALLDGEEVVHRESGKTTHVRLRHPFEDRYIDRSGIPVYVAADGPRALGAAGERGDGWIMSLHGADLIADSPAMFRASLQAVKEAAARSRRELDDFYTMASVGLCVLEDGEPLTSPRVLERVGPVAMLPFHAYADNPEIAAYLPPPVRDRLDIYEKNVLARFSVPRDRRYQEVHRGHLSHLLPGEAEVLTDEVIRATTLTGTAAEIVQVLRELEGAGLRGVMLNPAPHLVREAVREYAEKIAPQLGASGPESAKERGI